MDQEITYDLILNFNQAVTLLSSCTTNLEVLKEMYGKIAKEIEGQKDPDKAKLLEQELVMIDFHGHYLNQLIPEIEELINLFQAERNIPEKPKIIKPFWDAGTPDN